MEGGLRPCRAPRSDGKVFLAADAVWSDDPWQDVCAHVPQAEQLFREAELIALVNWSELDTSQALWKAVYDRAVRPDRANFSRFAFFDLCDCTRRSAEQLDQVLKLLTTLGRTSVRTFRRLSSCSVRPS